jgi:ferric-dicitrate binding protein FerR (iron transport regulator)
MILNNVNKSTKHTETEARSLSQERFDLLSAYLDGEVTASERQQVQAWLDTDEQFQHQYHQLLLMQQGLNRAPAPAIASCDLSQQVFHRLDRRRNQRNWAIAGGFTLLALVTSLISQYNPLENSWVPKLANHFSAPAQINPEPLVLALNRPLVEIPAAAE